MDMNRSPQYRVFLRNVKGQLLSAPVQVIIETKSMDVLRHRVGYPSQADPEPNAPQADQEKIA
jgi:hypothetical protein